MDTGRSWVLLSSGCAHNRCPQHRGCGPFPPLFLTAMTVPPSGGCLPMAGAVRVPHAQCD